MEKPELDAIFLASHPDKQEIIIKESANESVCSFYNKFVSTLPLEQADELIKNHNFTFFKILNKRIRLTTPNLYKFIYNLGGVSAPFEENGKTFDYAQKSTEFLKSMFFKRKLSLNIMSNISALMEPKGFNKEFTDFFIENFDELSSEEKINHGFIANCYNKFDEVQKTNTNNHGSQRQLKATVQKFKDYFNENKFENVTDETKEIAKTISPCFSEQKDFDNAVSMFQEKKSNNIPDHLLKSPVTDNAFDAIDNYEKKISELQINTISNLIDISKTQFTFEWLSKNDPRNLILGKLCNCCAHLEGVGYGIVHASIVHPNMQTMVIKDNNDQIIAKGTLYINPDEKYGIINSFQVADCVKSDKYTAVYKKFMQSIRKFAMQYNKENPNKQLNQINVGMAFNDLSGELRYRNKRSPSLFVPFDFTKYASAEHGKNYLGDGIFEQQVIWSKEKENIFKDPEFNPYE